MIEFTNEQAVIEAIKRRLPYAMQWTMARTLTDVVAETRIEIPRAIDSEMIVRNKTFVRASTRYIGARGNQKIDAQVAYVGTIAKKRATGWIEQKTGGLDKRKRKWTKAARKGGKSQVLQKYRFKPGTDILKLSDFRGRNLGRLIRHVVKNRHFNRPVLIGKPYEGSRHVQGVVYFSEHQIEIADKRPKYKGKKRMKYLIVKIANQDEHKVEKVDILKKAWQMYRLKNIYRVEQLWRGHYREQFSRISI